MTSAFTLHATLRVPPVEWEVMDLVRHAAADGAAFRLCVVESSGSAGWLVFELRTDWRDEPLHIGIPLQRIGRAERVDAIARYTGVRLELFIDGVLVDEEWPVGEPRWGTASLALDTDPRVVERAALIPRALSDAEIVELSGGRDAVERRAPPLLGEAPSHMQYWKPPGHTAFAGDCMPFFHDGQFHLFYLFDRHHHRSKWRLGAHQWAHASTADLIHWQHHPLAVPITEQWEGSICTGSVFHWNETYYAFYATRTIDGSPAPIQVAVSRDGIQFEKTPPLAVLTAPYAPAPARDPVVFHNGAAHYRMSRSPFGPWLRPANDTFDGPQLRVMKTAAFTGDRRIGAGFLAIEGYAGQVVFREIVPHEDGTLGTRFPAEMAPTAGAPVHLAGAPLAGQVTAGQDSARITAWEGFGAVAFGGIPHHTRITCRVNPSPGSAQFGVCLRGAGNYQGGYELRFEPHRRKAGWRQTTSGSIAENENAALYNVEGLDRPFTLDLVARDDILDVCIDNRRTIVVRAPTGLSSDQLFCFVQNGEVAFEQMEVRPCTT